MSQEEAQFQHAADLRAAFYALVDASILVIEDKEQSITEIAQKLSRLEEELETQLGYSFSFSFEAKAKNIGKALKKQVLPSLMSFQRMIMIQENNRNYLQSILAQERIKLRS